MSDEQQKVSRKVIAVKRVGRIEENKVKAARGRGQKRLSCLRVHRDCGGPMWCRRDKGLGVVACNRRGRRGFLNKSHRRGAPTGCLETEGPRSGVEIEHSGADHRTAGVER